MQQAFLDRRTPGLFFPKLMKDRFINLKHHSFLARLTLVKTDSYSLLWYLENHQQLQNTLAVKWQYSYYIIWTDLQESLET